MIIVNDHSTHPLAHLKTFAEEPAAEEEPASEEPAEEEEPAQDGAGYLYAWAVTTSYMYLYSGDAAEMEVGVDAEDDAVLSYQWYVKRWNEDDYTAIPGATDKTYTDTAPVKATYYCEVKDQSGGSDTAYFYIQYIENDLYIYGDMYSRTVELGASTTLSVTVEALDMTDLVYTWYKGELKKEDGYEYYEYTTPIEGATSSSYTIQEVREYAPYRCTVTDRYGNESYTTLYVYVDNQLRLERVSSYTVYAALNTTAKLEVSVSALDKDGITLQWYDNSTGKAIDKATKSSYTTPKVTGVQSYYCQARDKYGNSTSVSFQVRVDNALKVTAVSGKQTNYVKKNATLKLQVKATATDTKGITYQWYGRVYNEEYGYYTNGALSGATKASYTTPAITETTNYYCVVKDAYGHSSRVDFYISIDNELRVKAITPRNLLVTKGKTTTLKVSATAKDTSNLRYQWYDDHWTPIEGETGTSFTTPKLTKNTNYYCEVTDGTSYRNAWFNLFVEAEDRSNPLKAEAVGESMRFVAKGKTTTLKVTASSTASKKLTYQWYVEKYDPYYGGLGSSEEVPGATKASLTTPKVSSSLYYYCVIRDGENNSTTVSFTVNVQNKFSVTPVGDVTRILAKGKTTTLKVKATATDTKGLTYQWYHQNYNANRYYDGYYEEGYSGGGGEPILGATSASYKTPKTTRNMIYSCEVTDAYGNTETIRFTVYVNNNFSVKASGSTTKTIVSGKTATLKVTVTAKNKTGLTYRWYREEEDRGYYEISGATKASYTTPKLSEPGEYYCEVTDAYGNQETVWFSVVIKNGFSVKASGSTTKTVAKGKTATLKVTATATKKNGLSYQWYMYIPGYGYYAVDGATKASFTTPKLSMATEFYCQVKDTYGNRASVYFDVGIKNGFTAKASGGEDKTVDKGKTATLKVAVTATKKTGMTYAWYQLVRTPYGYSSWQRVSGAEGASYTTKAISEYTRFYCVVTDCYDNSKTVYFNVRVKSGFSAKLGAGYTQKTAKNVLTGEKESFYCYSVKKNGSITLSLSTTGSTEGVTYSWYKVTANGSSQVGTAKTLKLAKVTETTQYRVVVTDALGNPTTYNIRVVVS